jgi:alanyl aminopeptidase
MQLRYSDGGKAYSTQVMLDQDEMTVDLPAEGKVTWVVPNAEATGYYRWNLPPEMLIEMASRSGEILSTVERVHFLHNLSALFDAGILGGDEYLTILAGFANDPDPQVLSSTISGLGSIYDLFIREKYEDAFAPVMRNMYQPALDRIGLEVVPGESPTITDLRTTLLGWLSNEGQDMNLRQHMQEMAQKYIETGEVADPQSLSIAVAISARYGNAVLFDQYQKLFESAKLPTDRRMYLSALGNFRSDSLIKIALDFSLTDAMRPQELLRIPYGISDNLNKEEFMFDWVLENYDVLCSNMPSRFQVSLIAFAGGRSMERVQTARDFFTDSARFVNGVTERLAEVEADVKLRVTLIEKDRDAVERCVERMCQEASK